MLRQLDMVGPADACGMPIRRAATDSLISRAGASRPAFHGHVQEQLQVRQVPQQPRDVCALPGARRVALRTSPCRGKGVFEGGGALSPPQIGPRYKCFSAPSSTVKYGGCRASDVQPTLHLLISDKTDASPARSMPRRASNSAGHPSLRPTRSSGPFLPTSTPLAPSSSKCQSGPSQPA